MRLLLDSHALIWFCEGNDALSAAARAAIEDPANAKHVSHATVWEIAIKLSLGKLTLAVPFEDFCPGVIRRNGFAMLPTECAHYHRLIALPWHHRDPFDRLLIAQALTDNLTVLTRDPTFPRYGVDTLW